MAILPTNLLFKYLVTSTGGIDMNVDASSAGVVSTFAYIVPSSQTAEIRRVNIILVDGAIKFGSFGGISALANGVEIGVYDSSSNIALDFTDGNPIKANEEWGALVGTDNVVHPAAGDDGFPIRWTIQKAAGEHLKLGPRESFRFIINDDLSGLTKFRVMVQGRVTREEMDYVVYE